jgi:hypothetical protein
MMESMRRWAWAGAFVLLLGLGCDGGTEDDAGVTPGGKSDLAAEGTAQYVADMARLNADFPGATPMQVVEDAFRVTVVVGDQPLVADTHLFGGPVNVIPFSDTDNVTDAAGEAVARGDDIVAAYFPPGEIGIGVRHHRPQYRVLDLEGADASTMKEHFKFQDTHIEVVIGVVRDGLPGAITVNNPQGYQSGRFGTAQYAPIFLRPVYPAYLDDALVRQFRDNIRTMLVGFNSVSNFPGDYNGGDPLAANTPERVREHAVMMVRAVAGDAEARAWFEEPAHQIYCAELAHVAFSAGLIMPLNAATFEPLVGAPTWQAFVAAVAAHNSGQQTAFTELNENQLVSLVQLQIAPEDLRAAPSYAPAGSGDDQRLAFQPMTMADIVEQWMRSHIPREVFGESLAPVQAAVLTQMRPGLLETMGMSQLPTTDPRRVAVEALFDQLVTVVGTQYASYDAFRAALAPLLEQARQITGPRDDSGTGLFVPPSVMHLVAQGRNPGGLVGLRYVGHGLHYSQVRRATAPTTEPAPEPDPDPQPDPIGGVLLEEEGDVAEGQDASFTVTAPAGARRLRVEMLSTGDPDLYVRRGQAPDEATYDCRPYHAANHDEVCEFAPPGSDTYHIMIRSFEGSAHYALSASAE